MGQRGPASQGALLDNGTGSTAAARVTPQSPTLKPRWLSAQGTSPGAVRRLSRSQPRPAAGPSHAAASNPAVMTSGLAPLSSQSAQGNYWQAAGQNQQLAQPVRPSAAVYSSPQTAMRSIAPGLGPYG